MDNFSFKKSDRHEVIITGSPLWRVFDFILLLACLLILDFEIRLRLGNGILFYSKLSFLAHLTAETLHKGTWFENAVYVVPCGLIMVSAINLGWDFKYVFDGAANRAVMVKSLYLIPVERHDFPFEAAKEISLNKRKGRRGAYDLTVEEGSGKKITLLESRKPDRLWSLAKKIQEVTNLPVVQKIHS